MSHTKTRKPAAETRWARYYAIRIRKNDGLHWKVYVSKGYEDALRKAEHADGCIEVTEVHQLTREEYLKAIDNLKKGAVK